MTRKERGWYVTKISTKNKSGDVAFAQSASYATRTLFLFLQSFKTLKIYPWYELVFSFYCVFCWSILQFLCMLLSGTTWVTCILKFPLPSHAVNRNRYHVRACACSTCAWYSNVPFMKIFWLCCISLVFPLPSFPVFFLLSE